MVRLTGFDTARAIPEITGATESDTAIASRKLAGKRVLFLINLDGGGGVEKMTRVLSAAFSAWGATVETLTLYENANGTSLKKLSDVLASPFRIARAKPNIIVTFQSTSSVVAALTRIFLPSCKSHLVHQSNMPLGTHIVPRTLDYLLGSTGFFPVIVANSKATEKAFEDYPQSYKKRLVRIEHGLDWQPPRRTRKDVRAEIGVSEETPLIVTCARLSAQKKIDTVISALAELDGVHFAIAGDGPHRHELETIAAELGLTDRVHFLGHKAPDFIPDFNAAGDIFAFPSCFETFGLAPLEAAMQGTPVVAGPLDVTREVLTIDGQCPAKFVADWETTSWVNALREAFADKSFKHAAEAAAPVYRHRYSEEEMLQKYARLIADKLPG